MKFVIITTPLGQGHNAVAANLSAYLDKKGVSNTTIDLYEYIQPKLKDIISAGYFFSMKSAAAVKGFASDFYGKRDKKAVNSEYSIAHITNQILASQLKKFLLENAPDVVICTQVFAAQVVNILKEKKAISALAVGIITDFTVQNLWEDTQHFDYIVTGNERLAYQLSTRNIVSSKVLPLGIPIHEKFSMSMDKLEARKQLKLSPYRNTLLVMSGGMGFGNMEKYILELSRSGMDIQIIVVCGKNKRMYHRINRLEVDMPLHILDYVDNVDVLMSAADGILTKPGGITSSESLAKHLPMIMIDPLPGVEDRNVEFLLNNGAALLVTKTFTITEAVRLLFEYPETKKHLLQGIDMLAKPYATQQLCDFLIEKVGQNSQQSVQTV